MKEMVFEWKIDPLKGLGPLRFGMTTTEVSKILDQVRPVTDSRVMFDASTSEFRGLGFPVCNYRDGRLRGVDTDFRVSRVMLGETDVYNSGSRAVILELNKLNGGTKYGVGITLFDQISVTTSGFFVPKRGFFRDGFDDGQDERTLGVYIARAFDPLMAEFRNVKLPSR